MKIPTLNLYVAGRSPHGTIAGAVNDASSGTSKGAVWVPSDYPGVEAVPVNPGVPVFDMRGTAGTFTGASASPNSATIYAWDPKYGLKADAKFICDATFTSGSATVSSTAGDRPFTAADVGKIMWGANATCSGEGTPGIPAMRIVQGTITGFTDGNHVTVSHTASASCTPNGTGDGCVFVWGSDDTNAMQSAWNDAANACGTLVLPAGGILLQVPPNNTTTKCPVQTGTNDAAVTFTVYGQGPYSTMLLMSPSTTFGSSMFGLPTANYNRTLFHDFGIASFSPGPAASNGAGGFFIGFYGEIHHVFALNYFPCDNISCSNQFTPIVAIGVGNASAYVHDNILMYAGNTAVSIAGGVTFENNVLDFNNRCLSVTGGTNYSRGNTYVLCGIQAAINIASGVNTFYSTDDAVSCTGTGLACIVVSGSSGTTFIARNLTANQGATTTGPVFTISSGNTVVLDGSRNTVSLLSSNGGTGNAINNAGTVSLQGTTLFAAGGGVGLNNSGTATIRDGNTFGNGITNSGTIQGQPGQGALVGSCSGVATAASTLGLFQLGTLAATTCTSTTTTLGPVMSKAGTAYGLFVTAGAGGVNASSGVFTVLKNGAAQALTCTTGTGTSCNDGAAAHTFSFVKGDVLSVQFTTQTAETLSTINALIVTN